MAKILTGRINPTGKLTQSWPAASEDTPITDSPEHLAERGVGIGEGENVRIRMSEGIFNGYRYYDKYGVKPLYAFGHGLSYTTYEYSDLSVEEIQADPEKDPAAKDFGSTLTVRLKVTNTGKTEGDEIVQVYLGKGAVPEYMQMAEKQLVGYQRVKNIAPGQTKEAVITIDPRMLCSWDPAQSMQTRSDGTKDKWVRVTGAREILVGASSDDIRLRKTVMV